MSVNPTTYSPHLIDFDLFDMLLDQVEAAVSTSGGRNNLSGWICKNTSNPLNPLKAWSFEEHEFQIAIVDSQHPRTYIRKASQLGVSEVIVRIALALLAKMQGRHAIYTLPDATFAKKFAPSRFDPVVAASSKLKKLMGDLNNNEIKQIAQSYLHIGGAQKESQSISVPASMLFMDEVAYSNLEVLGTYESRLGHLKEGMEIVFGFSTPLLNNSDIDQMYQSGTQDSYMVFHVGCSRWVPLDPLIDIVVPGLEVPIDQFSKIDMDNPKVRIDLAFVRCPHCGQPISQENLASPSHRAWVPKYPDRYARSFDANFLVLPAIKTVQKVLRDRKNYRSTGKWVNFAIGVPADSADARISPAAIEKAFQTKEVSPNDMRGVYLPNIALGMDVGKVGHLAVGQRQGSVLHVLFLDTPKQDKDNFLATNFSEVYGRYTARQGVIDAGPEFSVVTKSQAMTPYATVHGCYFTRGDGKSDLKYYETNIEKGVVMVQRTKALNLFVEDFNKGNILLPRNSICEKLLRHHLPNMARVTDYDGNNEEKAKWVSTGDDHFFFAIFYLWLAMDMFINDPHSVVIPDYGNIVTTVRIKS